MIKLTLQPEPENFDRIRRQGAYAIALLTGNPLPKWPGPGPAPQRTLTQRGQTRDKTIDDFDYWTGCLDDLHAAYGGICAYLCFRVEKLSLPHVDHFVAKSRNDHALAYEWSNFRLACGYANACKGKFEDILDPTQIEDGWFQLDIDTLEVRAAREGEVPELGADRRAAINNTIARLKLNGDDALDMRRRYFQHFLHRRGNLDFLSMDCPFLARELIRQGVRDPDDLLPAALRDTVEPEE